MHKKFQWRRYLVALFTGIFAVAGMVVAVDAPARAALGDTSEIDYALSLGASQALSTPDANLLDLSANFTMEFWYKTSSIGSRMILNKEHSYEIGTDANGKFGYALMSGGVWDWHYTTAVIPNGRWVHVAFTKASTVTKLFFDGQQVWTQTGGVTTSNSNVPSNPATLDNQTSYFMVGGRANVNSGLGSATASGSGSTIDELKIWNTERTQANIAASMHEKATSGASGLVAYWNFNEGTTSNSAASNFDRSGNNLHLTFFGTPTSSNGNFVDVKTTARSNGKTVLTFPRTYLPGVAGWTVPAGATRADYLAVAGGGTGGSMHAGGGGAGELKAATSYALTPGNTLTIKVGQGGVALPSAVGVVQPGANGQNTIFGNTTLVGGGRGESNYYPLGLGGGGNGSGLTLGSIPSPTEGLRNLGGLGASGTNYLGGGGGGALSAGSAAASVAGAGGAGYPSSISGGLVCYAAGGGGGSQATGTAGLGGLCAGVSESSAGSGSKGSEVQTAAGVKPSTMHAKANSGSGGGGGGFGSTWIGAGGDGGSGVVIVAYASTDDNFMNFSGSGQYASKSGAQVIPATGAFTVEAWVKPTNDPALTAAVIVSQGNASNNRFYFKRSNAGDLIALREGGAEITCANIPQNEWVHVAVSLDGANMRCFVNGVKVKEVSYTASTAIGTGFYVGQYSYLPSSTNTYWKGGIDQVKIWNTAITDQAVIARSMHMHSATDGTGTVSGLTNHFDFNEVSGSSTVEDRVGSSTLTVNGAPTLDSVVEASITSTKSLYTFKRSVLTAWGGWLSQTSTSNADVLLTAGGGGAGKSVGRTTSPVGGSGGGGGVRSLTAQPLANGTIYPVLVGAGGQGATSVADDASNRNGQASNFSGTIALGGGGGGSSTYAGAGGSNVATGGGAGGIAGLACGSATNNGGVATSGFNGGQGILSWGGAGAGAGGASPARNCAQEYGTSGPGVSSAISGSTVEYGRGGWAGPASSAPSSNSNPGSGGSVSYGAVSGDGSGYAGKNGLVIVSIRTLYTVTFNGNGGSGTMSEQSGIGSAALNSNTFVAPAGSFFAGWATTNNATSATYANGASFNFSADTTLYAVWTNPVINLDASSTSSLPTNGSSWTSIAPGTSNLSSTAVGGGASYSAGPPKSLYLPSTAYVNMGANNAANISGAITVEVWAKCSAYRAGDQWNILASKWFSGPTSTTGTNNDWHFGIYGNKLNLYTTNSSLKTSNTTWDSTTCATWNQYVFTIDPANNNTLTFYVNGVADGSHTGVTHTTNSTSILQIGDGRGTPVGFQGYYSSFRMYNVALTSTQVASNYSTYNASLAAVKTVTYDYNGATGGDGAISDSYTSGGTVITLPTPTKTGYTFAGWYTGSDFAAGTSIGTTTYSPTESVTAYAKWTANTLNVTYESNGGSAVSGSTTTTGATIASAPTPPTKAGYAFAGWYEEVGLSTQAVFPNFVHGKTANFTLYAKWNANPTRTVTYALAGGSSFLPTQSAVQDGLTFTVANTPVRFGYTFTGWHDGTASYSQGDTYTVGSSNITLTATWSADILNVAWNSNGGSSVSGTTSVTGGTITAAPTNPTKSGYNFDGWYKEAGLTNEAVFPNFVHGKGEDFTLYAKWAAATFTITYKAGGAGTGADIVQSFVYGNSATIKDETAPITRAGYSISGWASIDGGAETRALESSYASAANIILYPVWSANTNAVAYDEQGGSSVSNGSFATGSTLTLPAASVRSGYTFAGWYTASTGGTRLGDASATISPTATADLSVYAQWTAINYTVTYDGRTPTAGSVPTDIANYNIGSAIAVLGNTGNLTKTGYAFGGWTTASDGTGTIYNSGDGYIFGAANVTFYAKWLANTYTITYNTNGATSGAPTNATQTYTSGNSGITLTTVGSLVKTGYDFGGWATTPAGAALSGAYTTSADVTLYAVWNVKTVNVTYDRGLATSVSTFPSNTTSIFGARYSISSMVSSIGTVGGAGLKFVGWSDGVSIYAAGEPYLVGDTDVTFTAQWVHVYEVRYTLNGGTGVLLDSASCTTSNGSGGYVCTDGQSIAANQAPTKPGYNFTGWKDQSNLAIAAGASFTVNSGSYLLYAQWTPIDYTVTYSAAGGVYTPTEASKNIGEFFTLANGISRAGYTFNGWSDGTRNYGAGASYQMASSNVTLTAQWIANVYTISYDWNGGTGTSSANDSYTVGTSGLTLPSVGDHVKDGYSFAGWSETRNGTALTGAYQATQSRTLYAVWGSGSFTVTYDANGGTAATSSAAVVNGGSAVLPSATRANYVFEGWYSAQTGGSNRGMAAAVFTPSGSTTLYARWTQLSLYGIDPAHLTRVGSLNASGIDSSYSGSNAGSSVQVTVPANTLPTGTTVNMDLVTDFTRAGNLLTDPANFIVSLVVSWVASDGTVPNTYSGKAVSVTIQNASIKAGSSVYSILGSEVTLLGTAINDGSVTVSLTQDPEIVIAATKPTAPQTVTAVAGQTGTANVSWSAPSSTGGATITGYTVTASTGQTCATATTSCAVTGLTSGASYTFTVTATNAVGTSVASAASSALSFSSTPISSLISGSPNIGSPVAKAPIVSNDRGQQIIEISQKKVATTGGSILKVDTKNMDDISTVTVNGKKAKILGVVDGEIKLQIPAGTKGDAKVIFSGPTGSIAMEQIVSFVAPKPVDVVASAAMPQGIWTIATPAVQALRKTLLANPDTVLIKCVGYQSLAYNTSLDALVAKQRAKTACQYLASQAPGVAVKTSVVRTKLTGPASRKLKVTFSAVR